MEEPIPTSTSEIAHEQNDAEFGQKEEGHNPTLMEDLQEEQNNHENQQHETITPSEEPQLSKSQQKKLKRRQQWEDGREFRKARRREKNKERKARKRASTEQQNQEEAAELRQEKRPPQPSILLPLTFIYDCGFDDLMSEPEITSLSGQITRAYSDNRRAAYSAHVTVCSFNGKLKERFEGVLESAHEQWRGITFTPDDFVTASARAAEEMKTSHPQVVPRKRQKKRAMQTAVDLPHFNGTDSKSKPVASSTEAPADAKADGDANADTAAKFEADAVADEATEANAETQTPQTGPNDQKFYRKGETIYLTADSPNILTKLSPHSTYIIGGLVDKNREKGICYKRACDAGIQTAKLPISEYMKMNSRQVLATSHVGEIMLRWLEVGDWGVAFDKVIPKRKGGILRGTSCEDAGNDVGEVDEMEREEEYDDNVDDDQDKWHEEEIGDETGDEGYE